MNAIRTDTIAAPATPPGRSSVAMFRISGPSAFSLCNRILKQRKLTQDYSTQTIHRALIVDGTDTVDDVLVAVYHDPRSYTGEDVVEITCHGGSVPIRRIMGLLLSNGARHAEPGEFTLRAYLNGKLDLAQAEAVCDLIDARTDTAFRLAQAQQQGGLSAEAKALRDILLGVVVQIEATIDFPEDVGEFPAEQCLAELAGVAERLDRLIATADRGMLYREGISVVLAGRPNSGKSSLLNALLRADRAIVTPIAGTTRDVIEESISIRGIHVRLSDTAGLRESADEVERLGVARTHERVGSADIVLVVRDVTEPSKPGDECERLSGSAPRITVWNKIDLMPGHRVVAGGMPVSALTGEGIPELEDRIADTAIGALGDEPAESSAGSVVTHARHKHALVEARQALDRAQIALTQEQPLDFLSIEVQCALSAIGLITGQTAPQEIVNEIFHRFCIGK
jgi:tRNA modification GTPase